MMSKAEWFVVRKPEIIAKSANQFCGGTKMLSFLLDG